MSTIVAVWSYVCLAVVIGLVFASRRLGAPRAAAWLVTLGLLLLVLEEPALTLFLGLTGPGGDRDAMTGLITPQARAHVIDAAVFSLLLFVLLGWVAQRPFRRGERWAARLLGWSLAVVAAAELGTTILVFSRGLPLPTAGGAAGAAGFGWKPVAVGLIAWGSGLIVMRQPRPIPVRAEHHPA